MRVFFIGALMVFAMFSCKTENEDKVIYFVRHAEKDVLPKKNPPLTTDGVIRSVDLATWFKGIEIDSIFSTDYLRMRETVKPVAESKNLEISIYEAMEFEAFADQLKEMSADTILVAGHSNTILEQIEALGIDRPQPEIKENEYDKIFEVILSDRKVKTHSYGSKFEE